ncbi:hypothetical protein DM793_01580 [Paenarthrobacter nitroguajacolicus]|uniref:hypothetical protein n=1 Tax=Paenarthrobacter nitroguajacolicus TaxID=211146 RepID=UPI0015B99E8D|nr:hypothetical protein [Paenarthrobacter nitroguajacolicus]NWL09996.1 hypothetical protein [Paenarthrobacter nitroguajacolicus]
MQGLVWRLKALDPVASESLKVIAYFDTLINSRANADMLIRGAAALCGCPVGYSLEGRSVCVDASGQSITEQQGQWPSQPFGIDGKAWIQRARPGFVNDELILERLALALGVFWDRTSPVAITRRAMEAVIDGDMPEEKRSEAARLLRLDRDRMYRVHAVPVTTSLPGPTALVQTPFGAIKAGIRPSAAALEEVSPTGVGLARAPRELYYSWETALLALRLTTSRRSVQTADELGSLVVLAGRADDSAQEPTDVTALRLLVEGQPKALPILDAIAEASSLRSVAGQLNLHHSSVQSRAAELSDALAFDIRTPAGRVRLTLALALFRLATNRFD